MPVFGEYKALFQVLRAVKINGGRIELADNSGAYGLYVRILHNRNKIVAANMPYKLVCWNALL